MIRGLFRTAAALKARYRPVFTGGLEREAKALQVLVAEINGTVADKGTTRAILGVTEGRGI